MLDVLRTVDEISPRAIELADARPKVVAAYVHVHRTLDVAGRELGRRAHVEHHHIRGTLKGRRRTDISDRVGSRLHLLAKANGNDQKAEGTKHEASPTSGETA